jgi:hypothetical protein
MKLINNEKLIMKYTRLFVFLTVIPFFISCGNKQDNKDLIANNPNNAELEDFHWLEGTWEDSKTFGFKTPPQIFVEEWKVYPDSMSGKGYYIKGSDTTLIELLSLIKTDDQVVYVARPLGQPIIGFPFKGIDQDQYLFENKAHDFPQKIGYHPKSKDSLDIYLEGISNGMNRKIKYTFVKK